MPLKVYESLFYVCGRTHTWSFIKHRWRTPGPPFYLVWRCRNCLTTVSKIIEYKVDREGNTIPTARTHIEISGRTIAVDTVVEQTNLLKHKTQKYPQEG